MENKMSRQIQIRRGSAAENDAFTGAIGEVTMDTTNNTLRVHDGTTAGGTKLAKQSEIPAPYTMPNNYDFVIESQMPTSSNNYKWYRKYKSGWVEQGGYVQPFTGTGSVSLPVTMENGHYFISAIADQGSKTFAIPSRSTTSFGIQYKAIEGTSPAGAIWMVSGVAA